MQNVSSESTFSRAFAEYAKASLGTRVHGVLVKEHLGTELIGHVSRDSTAIVGREKPTKKVKAPKVAKKRTPGERGDTATFRAEAA